jgi:hypothetical protein
VVAARPNVIARETMDDEATRLRGGWFDAQASVSDRMAGPRATHAPVRYVAAKCLRNFM